MIGSAVIVFRETLEAALLIGIIAAATRGLIGRNFWLAIGIGAGLVGSLIVAGLTETIGELAEGTGQEIFNATILGIAVLMLGWHNIWMTTHGREMAAQAKTVGHEVKTGQREMSALAILIALASTRFETIAIIKKSNGAWRDLREGFHHTFGFMPIRMLLLQLSIVSFMAMPYTSLDVLAPTIGTAPFAPSALYTLYRVEYATVYNTRELNQMGRMSLNRFSTWSGSSGCGTRRV